MIFEKKDFRKSLDSVNRERGSRPEDTFLVIFWMILGFLRPDYSWKTQESGQARDKSENLICIL